MKAGYEVFKATVDGPGMPCRGLMVGVEDRRAAAAPAQAPAGASGDSWAVGVAVWLVGAGFFKVVLVSLN